MNDIFRWKDFLGFAKDILNNRLTVSESAEARYRAGISRAYYFVFHESEKYLLEIQPDYDVEVKGAKGSHDKVILGFKQMKNPHRKKIGNDLDKIKVMRVRADYDERPYNRRGERGSAVDELHQAIFYAEKISKQIARCRQHST